MAYAMFTEPRNGVVDVTIRRETKNKIMVTTENPLTDDQMRDLYWIVLAMSRSGMRLKDMLNKGDG